MGRVDGKGLSNPGPMIVKYAAPVRRYLVGLVLHIQVDLVVVSRVAYAQHTVLHDARAPLAQVGVGHAQKQLEGAVTPVIVSMTIVSMTIVSMAIVSMAIVSTAKVSMAIVSMAIVSMAIVSIAEAAGRSRSACRCARARPPPATAWCAPRARASVSLCGRGGGPRRRRPAPSDMQGVGGDEGGGEGI